jgi:hypothetical protein
MATAELRKTAIPACRAFFFEMGCRDANKGLDE